jgi:hypothetical protein
MEGRTGQGDAVDFPGTVGAVREAQPDVSRPAGTSVARDGASRILNGMRAMGGSGGPGEGVAAEVGKKERIGQAANYTSGLSSILQAGLSRTIFEADNVPSEAMTHSLLIMSPARRPSGSLLGQPAVGKSLNEFSASRSGQRDDGDLLGAMEGARKA